MKPLTVTLSPAVAALVREHARAQGVTYESLVEACVRLACAAGGRVVLEPWGVPETNERGMGNDDSNARNV